MPEVAGVASVFNKERTDQLKKMLALGSSYYAAPLFLFFSIADAFYYRSFFLEFLTYRLFTVLSLVVLNYFAQKSTSFTKVQIFATASMLSCSGPITLMIYRTHDAGSPYYCGLILVIVGLANTYRFNTPLYFINMAVITLPYFIILPLLLSQFDQSLYQLNAMFVFSAGVIAYVSRYFHENLYCQEFQSRQNLKNEISHRNEVIAQKTKEAVELTVLSKQFSPQVIQAIQSGNLNFSKPVHRGEICVIFIDIVSSTERLIRLDREDLNSIISMYMEDTMSTLLKYDITLDKFLGDGVLGFSNDPVKHDDYVERCLLAALEILNKIQSKQKTYDNLWLAEFRVRIGISSGYASVGFYGDQLTFRTYTALGRAVNLATRLCSVAGPHEILVSQDIVTKLEQRNATNNFDFLKGPNTQLKGFESDVIQIYALARAKGKGASLASKGMEICPNGHGVLFLDTDLKGHYVFKCRSCPYVLVDQQPDRTKKSA